MRESTLDDREFGRGPRRIFRHPGQTLVTVFASAIAVGTALLMLPWARRGDEPTGFVDALFTATSAVCVTGLSTVDVPNYWTPFGQVVILVLIQVGGLGLMTMASLLGLLITGRIGLRGRMTAAAETSTERLGSVGGVLVGVLKVTLVVEAVVAVLLTVRFAVGYDEPIGRAAYLGLFHSVSAFNNAGFALWSDSLASFIGDPWICLPLCAAVILGGLGFPVLFEIWRNTRRKGPRRRWSLHARITLWGSGLLLVAGFLFVTAAEWSNPGTLGGHSGLTKLLAGFTQSVMPRTAGFQSVDYAEVEESTLFVTTILMFIGGGSASTAGGIKVTTFFLLFFVILAEVRGEPDVEVANRRIDARAQRQALTVALLSVGLVVASSIGLMITADLRLGHALFEAVSAFATVGLSAVGTGNLPVTAQVLLIPLMFVGRLGPITLASALALHERQRRYRLPEGRPLIG